jgi:hypothetical protein
MEIDNKNILAINKILKSMLGTEELISRWWKSPNYAFNLKTPGEVWESGKPGQSEVINYILAAYSR